MPSLDSNGSTENCASYSCVVDHGDVTLICLLDISATFDKVDHYILVEHLKKAFGLRWQVKWIKSLLYSRTWTVTLNRKQSTWSKLQCGVLQGSVLGLILFLLYTAVLENSTQHGLSADTQLKFHQKAHQCLKRLPSLEVYVAEISDSMSSNQLKLNAEKIQFIWLGTCQQLAKINCSMITLDGNVINQSVDVTILEDFFDQEMTFRDAYEMG